MADPFEDIIGEFNADGYNGGTMDKVVRVLLDEPPAEATRLVLASLGRVYQSNSFVKLALGFIPAADFPRVVEAALAGLRDDLADDNAAEIIEHVALQSPRTLHAHLDELLAYSADVGGYVQLYPWRESEMLHFARLRAVIMDATADEAERGFAWAALLETRTPQAVALAEDAYPPQGTDRAHYRDRDSHLRSVDYVRGRDGALRRYDPPRVMHLVFPPGHIARGARSRWQMIHPTWHYTDVPATATARFGGEADGTCNCCGGTLHHLITLDPVPRDLGVTSVHALTIATCLSCLGWEVGPVAFYQHDAGDGAGAGAGGRPRDISVSERRKPEFVHGPFIEVDVRLMDAPPRWRWQEWASSSGAQNFHRIGGHPLWVQEADVPTCPHCAEPMNFLMQLDSDLPTTTMTEFPWGSGGVAYVFWCDPCRTSGLFWQCT